MDWAKLTPGPTAPPPPDDFIPDVVIWSAPPALPRPVAQLKTRGARFVLVDLRAPETQRFGILRRAGLARDALRRFDTILATDRAAGNWAAARNVPPDRIRVTGALQYGVAVDPCDETECARYAALISARPVWLVSCFDRREEDAILNVYRRMLRETHRLLLVIAPARGDEGPAIQRALDKSGLRCGRQSAGHDPTPETQVFVADDPADPRPWYRLAPIAFLGGTFHAGAGDNPMRPAALGSAILHGPETGGHAELFSVLAAAGATWRVTDEDTLCKAVSALLAPDKAAEMAHRAWRTATAGAGAIDALAETVVGIIDRSGGRT